jgi:hypothetical protein
MDNYDKQQQLTSLLQKMYKEKNTNLSKDYVLSIYDLGDKLELTIEEITNICELVYKILNGDQTLGSTETALLEILDEDNQQNMGAISAFITTEVIDRIKGDLYGRKSDLLPNLHEPVVPATPASPIQTSSPSNISDTIYEKISREQVLRELENPPPAKFSTSTQKNSPPVPEKVEPKIPENLPTEEAQREVPIVRTMQRDIAKKSGEKLPAVKAPAIKEEFPFLSGTRGKFGSGNIPQIRQIKVGETNSIPTPIENNKIVIPTPPQPETKVESAPKLKIEIPKAENLSNPTEDKMTKRVHIPMERKNYNVDPYREALEE